MKAKIRVTNEHDIETSECGEFCGKDCKKKYNGMMCSLDVSKLDREIKNNGTAMVTWKDRRTKFCKSNEVKGLEDNKICQTLLKEYRKK